MISCNTLTLPFLIWSLQTVPFRLLSGVRWVVLQGSTQDQTDLTQLLIGLDLPEQVS
jgi:hypothetical protein